MRGQSKCMPCLKQISKKKKKKTRLLQEKQVKKVAISREAFLEEELGQCLDEENRNKSALSC